MKFVHGQHCQTRTFPTRCQYCNEPVYYFSCTCGSKVFFDELGDPWPQHRCEEYLQHRYSYLKNDTNAWNEMLGRAESMPRSGQEEARKSLTILDFLRLIADYKPEISDEVVKRAKRANKPDPGKAKPYEIIAQPPYKNNQIQAIDGVVREFILDANPAKKLQIDTGNRMGLALLGELGKGKFSQITIHCGGLEENVHESFTFFIASSKLKKLSIIKGDYIDVQLRSIQIPGRAAVWICDVIRGAFG